MDKRVNQILFRKLYTINLNVETAKLHSTMTRSNVLSIKFWCTLSISLILSITAFGQESLPKYNFDNGNEGWTFENPRSDSPIPLDLWSNESDGRADGAEYWADRSAIDSPSDDGALVCNPNRLNDLITETGSTPQTWTGSIVSPIIDISGIDSTLILKFNQYYRGYKDSTFIQVRDISSTSWDTIRLNTTLGPNTETRRDDVKYVDLTPFTRDAERIEIKFTFSGDYYFWIVDDIQLSESRPRPTLPHYLSGTLTELGYEFEVDDSGGVYIPNQLVVKYVDTATQNDRANVRASVNVTKYESCICNPQVELWYLGHSDDPSVSGNSNIIDINETTSTSQANSKVDEVDKNGINYNKLAPPYIDNSNPSYNDIAIANQDDLKIVIMDTGIDYTHNKLKAHIWKDDGYGNICTEISKPIIGYDFVDDDLYPFDLHSHGTHVAGIVQKKLASCGCPYKLVPVRTHDENGAATLFDVTCGFYFATEIEAHYINASFGYYGVESNILKVAIQDALDNNAIIVTASGNEGYNLGDSIQYPAYYSGINTYDEIFFTTGSADPASNVRHSFSNFSPTIVDYYAPGNLINSTIPGGGEAPKSGTSMAAPYLLASVVQARCTGEEKITGALDECKSKPNLSSKNEVPVVDITCLNNKGKGPVKPVEPKFPWLTIGIGIALLIVILLLLRNRAKK